MVEYIEGVYRERRALRMITKPGSKDCLLPICLSFGIDVLELRLSGGLKNPVLADKKRLTIADAEDSSVRKLAVCVQVVEVAAGINHKFSD
jgi:hypothetical protein